MAERRWKRRDLTNVEGGSRALEGARAVCAEMGEIRTAYFFRALACAAEFARQPERVAREQS